MGESAAAVLAEIHNILLTRRVMHRNEVNPLALYPINEAIVALQYLAIPPTVVFENKSA